MSTLASLLLTVVIATEGWDHVPQPAEFQVRSRYRYAGIPAQVRIDDRRARRYRTVLRRGAARGPNFAGRYTVVTWGCGLASYELAIIDAETGRVSWPPFGCMTLAPGLEFQIDSRLLVVTGVEDGTTEELKDRATPFYVFDRGRFRLLYRVPSVLPEEP